MKTKHTFVVDQIVDVVLIDIHGIVLRVIILDHRSTTNATLIFLLFLHKQTRIGHSRLFRLNHDFKKAKSMTLLRTILMMS